MVDHDPAQSSSAPNSAAPSLSVLARRLARRYLARLRFRSGVAWSGAAAGVALILAALRGAWWPSADWTLAFAALGVAWLGGLGWFWWRARADEARLLGEADRQVAAEEQIITTYELERTEPGNPFLPLLRKRIDSLVRRVDPRGLIPMQLHRVGMGALAFAVAAFVLFLMPSEWLRLTRAALTTGPSLVSEEGARIRRFAERMEEVASRENLPFAQALAKEAQIVGKAMEEKELSALDASEQVEGLIRLAEELASQAAREGKSGFTNEQNVGFESESQQQQSSGEAGSPAGYTGGGQDQIQEGTSGNMTGSQNEENMSTVDDPFNEKEPQADVSEDNEQKPRDMQVLERAQMQFQQAQRNIAEGSQSVAQQEGSASSAKDSMDDMGNAAPDEMSAQGQEKSQQANSLNENSGADAQPSDAFGQGPTNLRNDRDGKDDKPKDSGFQDSQVFGASSDAESQEKWVRQLPTLNAREIRPDGTVQDFQHAAVQAQGGSAVPRAYRAVVRSYFMHLERLNIDKEDEPLLSGEEEILAEPDVTPVAPPPDPGSTTGPEYQGVLEVPTADGGRGPNESQ